MTRKPRQHEIHWSAWKDSDGWGVCTADGEAVIVQPQFSNEKADMLRIVQAHNGDLDRRIRASIPAVPPRPEPMVMVSKGL